MFLKYMKWALCWALLILVLCGIPGRDIPHISFLELLSFDKWVHAGIFFVLICLMIRGFLLQTDFRLLQQKAKNSALYICVFYGGILEIMQGLLFEERSADVYDFIANALGSVGGFVVYEWVEKTILVKVIK